MVSFGMYTPFDHHAKELPKVRQCTDTIPARLGLEFGYIVRIRGAKGRTLHFTIDHPPFRNDAGEIAPPFVGEEFISANEYHFFLGDTFWEPLADKVGDWTLTVELDGEQIARKVFHVVAEEEEDDAARDESRTGWP